ncbi:MAG: hypothetical protein WD795_00655 [Woeseia sp.]
MAFGKSKSRRVKADEITSDDITPTTCNVPRMTNPDACDLLTGREPGNPVNSIEGANLSLDACLYKHVLGQYQLCIRLGPHWYSLLNISTGDRGLEPIRERMTVIGPSPSEVSMREKHAELQRQANEIAEGWQSKQRADAIRERKRAEAFERQRLLAAESRR